MAYTFRFATVAEYRAAKASGGVIYNALRPSSSTGSATNVSRSAVSFIAEIGRSVVDAVNVCVPYEQGGFVGDIKCYSPTHGEFWLKVDAAEWSTTSLGQNYFDSTTWPSTFVRIGFCFWRQGQNGLLCSMVNSGTTYAWQTDTTEISGVFTKSLVWQGTRHKTWIAGIMEAAEAAWGDTFYNYTWPCPRSLWDAAVDAAKKGITASGECYDNQNPPQKQSTWQASNGVATITVLYYGGTANVNPADYGYNFDDWYAENVGVRIPGPRDTATALRDEKGTNNDGVRNTRIMKQSGKSPAADFALSFAVNAPGYEAGRWWIPNLIELARMMRVYLRLNKAGANFTKTAYWSSTQYSSASAWSAHLYSGRVGNTTKTSPYLLRVVSGFFLNK